jgi:hypothetical protein
LALERSIDLGAVVGYDTEIEILTLFDEDKVLLKVSKDGNSMGKANLLI